MKEISVGKAKNLIGQKFDHLTIKFRTEGPENLKKKNVWWACECDCGNPNLIKIRGDRFSYEKNFSCGCAFKKMGRPIDNINLGERFGKWTVIDFIGVIDTHATWLCRCECGYEKNIAGTQLKNGQTKSCPKCCQTNALDISNLKFEKLTALYPTEKREGSFIVWHCICECGNECEVSLSNLKSGNTKSCGCIGQSYGEYCIQKKLNEEKISYTIQKSFKNCIFNTGYKAKFDFFIEDKYIIEYDGEQHFKYRYNDKYHGWNNKENFLLTRKHDLIKNKYCFDNNIPLIRIPYDADYAIDDLKLETTRFLLTPENEMEYYESRKNI